MLESILWLALNIYHEARSEPPLGQLAVAHVTLNRTTSSIRDTSPNRATVSIKNTVTAPYQFSWVQQGKLLPDDFDAFMQSIEYARIAVNGHDVTCGATHYHHISVIPEWTNRLDYVGQFGSHFFYTDEKGSNLPCAER